jgi:hypothetical protein
MYSVQVSREKAIKLLNKLQFFITNKKCTFCIMYWLVNINSKLKLIAQKKQKFLILDTKPYELSKNRLKILQNFI